MSLTAKPIETDGCIVRQLKVRFLSRPGELASSSRSSSANRLVSQSATNVSSSNVNNGDILNEYEFTQYHLTNWPDHGVPDSIESVVSILSKVRQKMSDNNRLANETLHRSNSNSNGKSKYSVPLSSDYLLVHCSAGCGRTGTIIAIDQLWTLIVENVINILVVWSILIIFK